ncbi:hypothetical protein D8Y24_09870 [Agrococcus lahaulensis]|nr:hypothetical protein D8Y24_09870 [Agrococcus lahaulensis]
MLARLGSGLALAAVAALALVGCSPPEPVATTPAAEPTVEPSVSTEEQLLADSIETVEAFLRLTDQAFASGELPTEELSSVASDELIEQLRVEVDQFAMQNLDVEGFSQLDTASLVEVENPMPESGEVLLLGCVDTSGVTTTDADGERVTGGVTRQPRVFSIAFEPNSMLVTGTTPPSEDPELPGCNS